MQCLLCSSDKLRFFEVETQEKKGKKIRAVECKNCRLIFLENYLSPRDGFYDCDYMVWGKEFEKNEKNISQAKKEAFRKQLKSLLKHVDPQGKKILDLGTGKGYLLEEAQEAGFEVFGLDISEYACKKAQRKFGDKIFHGRIEEAKYPDNFFDVVSATDYWEHISNPHLLIREISRILKLGGFLFIVTPNADSISRRILGKNWFQYKYEHVVYWSRKTLNLLLAEGGFEILSCANNCKRFNLKYYQLYFQKYSFAGLEKILLFLMKLIPEKWMQKCISNPVTGEIILVSRKTNASNILNCADSKG